MADTLAPSVSNPLPLLIMRLGATALALALVVFSHTSMVVAQGNYEWGIAAGGHSDFDTSAGGDCGDTSGQPCWIAGTHTIATIRDLHVVSNPLTSNIGFGVGQITTAGYFNHATITVSSPTDSFGDTKLRRACSIYGHMRQSLNQYSPRDRLISQLAYAYNINPDERTRFAIGIGMWGSSACTSYDNVHCQQEFWRWECAFGSKDAGLPEPPMRLHIPYSSGNTNGWYMPAGEAIASAEHGAFVGSNPPAEEDYTDIIFRDNRYYYFKAADRPDPCPDAPASCEDIFGFDSSFWRDNDLARPWQGAQWFSPTGSNIHVYDTGPSKWSVCVNRGGVCGGPEPSCDGKTWVYSGWARPRPYDCCMGCWAACAQSAFYNMRDREPSQCELIRLVWGRLHPCVPFCFWGLESYAMIWDIEDVLRNPVYGDVWRATLDEPPPFEDVKAEIDAGRSMLIQVRTRKGNTHVLLLYGYRCGGAWGPEVRLWDVGPILDANPLLVYNIPYDRLINPLPGDQYWLLAGIVFE